MDLLSLMSLASALLGATPAASSLPSPTSSLPVEVARTEAREPGSGPAAPATRFFLWTDPANERPDLGVEGGLGLFRLPTADLGKAGVFRLGLVGDLFHAANFPVLGADEKHLGLRFTASYVPLSWLETFLTFAGTSSANTNTLPLRILSVGDIALGVKAGGRLGRAFFGGVEARFLAYPAGAAVDSDAFGYGLQPMLLGGFDARALSPYLPLRLHAGLGVRLDWNHALGASPPLHASEEYALGVSRFNRLVFRAGAEIPLPGVTPFVEYGLAYPLNVAGGLLVSPDGTTLSPGAAMPQTLALGFKVTALRDVTLLAAVDLGLNRRVGLGIPASPPYDFFVGASFHADLVGAPATKVVEVVRAPPVPPSPPESVVEGRVTDAESHIPLASVMITSPGTSLPPVASAAETGRYRSYGVAGPEARLLFAREGYAEREVVVALEGGRTVQLDVTLQPLPHKALMALRVVSKGKAVEATVQLEGPVNQQVALPADITEPVRVELPPGRYALSVQAEGYLSQTRALQLADRADLAVDFELHPAPTRPLVQLRGNKLELSQAVHFAPGKTRLLADSFPLLQQVVDVLVKNNIARVRIEGHTDNQGNAAFNLRLSAARAQTVADYLVAQGVHRNHLETAGFGGSRPVAPNLTARGRELNRRVDFVVIGH